MPLVRWVFASSALCSCARIGGRDRQRIFDGNAHPYVGIAVAGDDSAPARSSRRRCSSRPGIAPRPSPATGETTFVTFDAQARPTSIRHRDAIHASRFFDVPPKGVGVPASVGHDVGVVVLDNAVELPRYAALPRLGALTVDRTASFTLAGYGANGWVTGGGRPFPTFDFDRMVASSRLIGVDAEFARLSTSPGQGDGGIGPGDSGGPALRRGPTSSRLSDPMARACGRPETATGTGWTRATRGRSWSGSRRAMSRRSDRALEWPRGRRRAQKVVECDSRGG